MPGAPLSRACLEQSGLYPEVGGADSSRGHKHLDLETDQVGYQVGEPLDVGPLQTGTQG
jgi:hypothetical protein